MAGMLVRIFKSRRHGGAFGRVDKLDVRVVAVERSAPTKVLAADGYDLGLLGVIERMFSGLLMDHAVAEGEAGGARRKVGFIAAGSASSNHIVPTDLDVLATIAGPQIYPLPNSPTGWRQSTRGEKVSIGVLTDPGRPDGLIADAQGLGTDAYNDMIAPENETKTGSEGQSGK